MTFGTNSRVPAERAFLRDLVAEMEHKVPYASILINENRSLSINSSTRMDRASETGPQAGAVLNAWTGEHFEEEVTSDLSRDGLAQAARNLIGRISVKSGGLSVDPGPPTTADYKTARRIDPAQVTISDKLELCREMRWQIQTADQRIVDASCRYNENHIKTTFVNRNRDLSQEITYLTFGPMIVISDGSTTRYDVVYNAGTGGYELAQVEQQEIDAMIARIPCLLQAKRVEPGLYNVITCPAASGLIAHESFGHGVETDMFLKGRARAHDYINRRVGSELVDLYDDPTWPAGPGSFFFDDEGQPASRTTVLDKGVLVSGLTDLNAAMRLKIPRTANGRRDGSGKAYARMTNTYFGAGPDKLEDMIASIEHGIYLGDIESGMEDPKGWGVQCVLRWGRAIEGGKLTDQYFTQVGLTGYVPDLLGSISMASDDIQLSGGTCGKGYKEWVRVGDGGPHMKMKARLG